MNVETSKQLSLKSTTEKRINYKMQQKRQFLQDISKSKKTNKLLPSWKEVKALMNKAASKIPKAPAVLQPIKRCTAASKIPCTPRGEKISRNCPSLQQQCDINTKPKQKKEQKTSILTMKRNPKRLAQNEERKVTSKRKGFQAKKQVDRSRQQEDRNTTLNCSLPSETLAVSARVSQRRTVKPTKHRFHDGLCGQSSYHSVRLETRECNRAESMLSCDPPVLGRDSEGRSERRRSNKILPSTSSMGNPKSSEDHTPTGSDLREECARCHLECMRASRKADRLLEEITFIRDSKPLRKRRDSIPPWIRQRYQVSQKQCASTPLKKSRGDRKQPTPVYPKSQRSIRDSPMDAATPTGGSLCMNAWGKQRRAEYLEDDIATFFNPRGQTPINLSGSWMHQLQKIAKKDLEAPLQIELRTCLARLAKLEFENRALKELVLIKCGLPKHLGMHKLGRAGSTSTLAEDPEDGCASEVSNSERINSQFYYPEIIDSAHDVFAHE